MTERCLVEPIIYPSDVFTILIKVMVKSFMDTDDTFLSNL